MRRPVCWGGMCFVHVRSNDVQHEYHADPGGPEEGRLVERRADGAWLASLRRRTAVALPEGPAWREDAHDVARRALDAALAQLAGPGVYLPAF